MTTTKSLLPSPKSFNERKADFKNRQEQIRLSKLLEHLDVQERVYVQLFRRQRQVLESRRRRTLAARVTSFSWTDSPTTTGRRLPPSVSFPKTNGHLTTICDQPLCSSASLDCKAPDRPLAIPSTTPDRYVDDREPRHHLLSAPPGGASYQNGRKEMLSQDDRSTRQHNPINATYQTQHVELASTKFSLSPGDPCSRQSMSKPVEDDTSVSAQHSNHIPAGVLLRSAPAAGRLLASVASSVNEESTAKHWCHFQRCISASNSLSLTMNKLPVDQETFSRCHTHRMCNGKCTEILPLKSEKVSLSDLLHRQRIARRSPRAISLVRRTENASDNNVKKSANKKVSEEARCVNGGKEKHET